MSFIQQNLKQHSWYLSSPYTGYATLVRKILGYDNWRLASYDAAWRDACRVMAAILKAAPDANVYSPIAEAHGIAEVGGLDWDHNNWLDRCKSQISLADAVLVATLPGWELSKGMEAEIDFAKELGLPVIYLDCDRTPPKTPPEGRLSIVHPDFRKEINDLVEKYV